MVFLLIHAMLEARWADEIAQAARLHRSGDLSDAEFTALKAMIIGTVTKQQAPETEPPTAIVPQPRPFAPGQVELWAGAEVPGYCDRTRLGEGSLCEPHDRKGSWVVATTDECVSLCQGCPQCRFISLLGTKCAWFSECAGFDEGRLHSPTSEIHRTRMMRRHNVSSLVRSSALKPSQLAATNSTFASMSCGSADLLPEKGWIRFYRATSAFAAMTLVTTAEDPCPLCAWTHLTMPRRGQPWGHWELRAQREAWRAHLHATAFDYYMYMRPDMTWFVPPQRLLELLRPDGSRLIFSPDHAYGRVWSPKWTNGTSKIINDRVAVVTRDAAPHFFNRAGRLEADLARGEVITEKLLFKEMLERAVVVKTFPTLAAVRCCPNPAGCAGRKALSGVQSTCTEITTSQGWSQWVRRAQREAWRAQLQRTAFEDGGEVNFTAKYKYEVGFALQNAVDLLARGGQLKLCPQGVCLHVEGAPGEAPGV